MANTKLNLTEDRRSIYFRRRRNYALIIVSAFVLGMFYSIVFNKDTSAVPLLALCVFAIYAVVGLIRNESVIQLLIAERRVQKKRKIDNLENLTSFAKKMEKDAKH